MPSGVPRAREVSLYERPVTSTATSVSRKSSGGAAIAAEKLGGLEGGLRVARARIGDQIQLVGERAGP